MKRVVDMKITLKRMTNVIPVIVAYISARRKLEVRNNLYRNTECIAGAAQGVNQRDRFTAIDLASQAADMSLHDRGIRFEMNIPDVFQQHGARHRLLGVFHQVFEQPKLARQQLDGGAAANDGAREQVNFKIGDLEIRFHRKSGASASQGGYPR